VILREIGREGQVFFIHNRVQSIDEVAGSLSTLVPEASITVAHGQMNEDQLAARMMGFIEGRYNVLVSTTIVESGLDIPNANTLVVDNADIFGLADLHQLRGRVGRYKRHAYTYFVLPETRPLSPESAKRLQAIEHFSELGSGFRIALRDMEIRGVGNVLGRQQSGHIALVGYELFCRLLGDAVHQLRGEPGKRIPDSFVELGTSNYIPETYIESPGHRLDLYRKLSSAVSVNEIGEIETETLDKFGAMPAEADEFFRTAKLRILSFRAGISMLVRRREHLAVQAGEAAIVRNIFEGDGRKVRVVDERDAVVVFAGETPSGTELLDTLINILQEAPARL
jgi:transcription-repair coupling factor (superfamily II helicase)